MKERQRKSPNVCNTHVYIEVSSAGTSTVPAVNELMQKLEE